MALVTARPDATLAELRDALPTTAALSTMLAGISLAGPHRQKNCPARRPPRYLLDEKLHVPLRSEHPGGLAANVLGDVANPKKNMVWGWLAT